MGTLPKPLIGLLLGTVAFFAIWMVALKPHSSSSGGSQGGVGQYQPAINQAHQAVTTSNQANAKLGAPTATTSAPTPAASTPPASTPAATTPAATTPAPATKTATTPATKHTATAATATNKASKAAPAKKPNSVPAATGADALKAAASGQIATFSFFTPDVVQAVNYGIKDHQQVVAVLFYNPAAADDRAMVGELAPLARNPLVLGVAVPVSKLTQFTAITSKVPVVTSPTLVIIDRTGQATELTGYADADEIGQRLNDALAAK
jgi:hypothetical protein